MYETLKIILYPDPRLKKVAAEIKTIDENIVELSQRMLELMREHKGVGLAAPQVGISLRLFVMNPTGEPDDDRIYINPTLTDAEGSQADEEGCLSIPKLTVKVDRSKTLRLRAQTLDGQDVDLIESGYIARIWQHEFDHLNGTLITDRMGPVAKLTHRKLLRDLEEQFTLQQPKPATRKRTSARK